MTYLSQSTKQKKLKPALTLLLVFGSVISVYIVNIILTLCVNKSLISFNVGSVLLWAYVVILFLLIFTRFCLISVYELDGVKLCFSRIYIKNPRLMEAIMLREVVFFGSPIDAKQKYEISGTKRFTSRRSPYAVQSLVYKREKEYKQILFCPDEKICEAILAARSK